MKNSFQEIVAKLNEYWADQGCAILQPYDMEVGAATFSPYTLLRAIGGKSWRCAHIQPCRRPADGRYGENPNRVHKLHQYQVVIKPSPDDIQDMYLKSLEIIGIDFRRHDIRFVEDDWESPTLGASGLGWEVWCDGMEITQFTYFQYAGGIACNPTTVELAYGIERIAMFLQNVDNIYDINWNGKDGDEAITYRDICFEQEVELSKYSFEYADTDMLKQSFSMAENECKRLVEANLPLVAYEQCIKSSHIFNLLDARGAFSVAERVDRISRVRMLAKLCCEAQARAHE